MNKPIRTISIFCLLLFLALMINATYLQYYRAGALEKDSRNRRVLAASFSGDRGAILVGREAVAESVKSDDQYEFQRRYPQPFKYSHVTGWFSYFSQTGIEQSQNDVLSGDDSLLFVTRLVDLLSNSTPKGGSVQLTLDPAAQDAAYAGLEAVPGEAEGAVVALEPTSGKILAMVSSPSYDPNLMASHDFGEVADTARRLGDADSEPLLNRSIQTTLPPGSTFKIVTAAAALESGNYADSDALVPGGPTYQLPLTSGESGVVDNEGRACGTDRIPIDPGDGAVLQHHVRPARRRARRRRHARAGGGFRLELDLPRRPAPAGALGLPRGHGRGPDGTVRLRAVERHLDPAADGDGGLRGRERRYRDEALRRRRGPLPRARRPRQDRADRALPGGLGLHRRGAQGDAGLHGHQRDREPGGHPGRRRRRQDRHRRERARPTCRRTPGSCRSPPPTTPRSPSR